MSASQGRNCVQGGFKCTTDDPGAYKFMQLDVSECAGGQVALERAGAGGKVFGVSYETTAAANRNIGVNMQGVCFLQVDGNVGAITPGAYLKADASGQGVATTTDGDEYGAVALDSSVAAGDIILAEIRKGRYAAAAG